MLPQFPTAGQRNVHGKEGEAEGKESIASSIIDTSLEERDDSDMSVIL